MRDLLPCFQQAKWDSDTHEQKEKVKLVHVKVTPTDVLFIGVYVQSTPPGPQHLTLHQ
jgi:hypothetical protein